LRICLVTPFSWSQPHDVNEHVAGLAAGLRDLGHSVTVLAPSGRAADLLAGRRALQDGLEADVIALGPALPISRRSRIGVPVGVRANLALALGRGEFDVVHGFEPALPSLSYLALLETRALSAATFFSPERLGYPPGRAQRERLLGRTDALLAVSERVAEAAAERFPGDYRVVTPGVDLELFRPAEKRRLAVVEWRPGDRALARAAVRVLRELTDWELVILRTKPLTGRPTSSTAVRDRVRVRTLRDGKSRAPLFGEAAIFLPSPNGLARVKLEAQAAGVALPGAARARRGRARATRRGRRPAGTRCRGGARRCGEPGLQRARA
jgi:phosphatidylinositol alpha-mannosyltransferase